MKMLVGSDLCTMSDVLEGFATSAGNDSGGDSVFERTFDLISPSDTMASHHYAQLTSLNFLQQ